MLLHHVQLSWLKVLHKVYVAKRRQCSCGPFGIVRSYVSCKIQMGHVASSCSTLMVKSLVIAKGDIIHLIPLALCSGGQELEGRINHVASQMSAFVAKRVSCEWCFKFLNMWQLARWSHGLLSMAYEGTWVGTNVTLWTTPIKTWQCIACE